MRQGIWLFYLHNNTFVQNLPILHVTCTTLQTSHTRARAHARTHVSLYIDHCHHTLLYNIHHDYGQDAPMRFVLRMCLSSMNTSGCLLWLQWLCENILYFLLLFFHLVSCLKKSMNSCVTNENLSKDSENESFIPFFLISWGSFLLFILGGGGCLFVVFVLFFFFFFCSNENCRFDVEASFFAMASLPVKFQHTWPVTI